MITVLPASPAAGVYVNANGDALADIGVTEPAPFSVIVTVVALLNVLPFIVTGAVTQVVPLVLVKIRVGPLAQPHATVKLVPVTVHPSVFLTVME